MRSHEKPAKARWVVTLTEEGFVHADEIADKLEGKGFVLLEKMEILPCLLGEFSGDRKELKAVDGVLDVEPEDTLHTQG